jgi:hypothetical protein
MEHPVDHCGLLYVGNRAVSRCLALYGAKGGAGLSAFKAKGLMLNHMMSRPLVKSIEFAQWVDDCGYIIEYPYR